MVEPEDMEHSLLKELKSWSIWLMIIGISQFVIPGMDRGWGVLLLALAAMSRLSRRPQLFIVFGGVLMFAGFSNLMVQSTGWNTFAFVQLGLGGYQFFNYSKYRSVGMDETPEATGLPLPDRYALASLILGITAVAASVVFLLYTVSLVGSGDGTLNLQQENTLDFLYSLISSGNLMGLFLGIASLSTPNRKRPAALIGTIINGLLFIGLIWLIL